MATTTLESTAGRLASLWLVCYTKMKELPQLTCLTKGIVYELSLLRKVYDIFHGVNSMIGLRNSVVDQLQLAHSK